VHHFRDAGAALKTERGGVESKTQDSVASEPRLSICLRNRIDAGYPGNIPALKWVFCPAGLAMQRSRPRDAGCVAHLGLRASDTLRFVRSIRRRRTEHVRDGARAFEDAGESGRTGLARRAAFYDTDARRSTRSGCGI
jgi:hypothetical protein